MSLSTGSGFATSTKWVNQFGYNHNWRIDRHPRYLMDVDGDQKADIVGFGNAGVWVALSTGSSFAPPQIWLNDFGYSAGGWRVDKNPRFVTDVDGDGKADIVGLSPGGGQKLMVSASTGSAFTTPREWADFVDILEPATVSETVTMADINGDGRADAVAFGGYEGTYFALSTGTTFTTFTKSRPWINEFGVDAGWKVSQHLRTLADIDGDGRADIVGFGGSGVWVWQADFCFAGEEN